MMKKILVLCLAAAMLLAAGACGAPAPSPETPQPTASPSPAATQQPEESQPEPTEQPETTSPEAGGLYAEDTPFAAKVKTALHSYISQYFISAGVGPEAFADGAMDSYLMEALPAGFAAIGDTPIRQELVQDGVVMLNMLNVRADAVYVLQAADEAGAKELEADLQEVQRRHKETWESYLPDQYEKVEKAAIGRVGNVAYYVVFDEVKELEEIIRAAVG